MLCAFHQALPQALAKYYGVTLEGKLQPCEGCGLAKAKQKAEGGRGYPRFQLHQLQQLKCIFTSMQQDHTARPQAGPNTSFQWSMSTADMDGFGHHTQNQKWLILSPRFLQNFDLLDTRLRS
jgi:hypothetical protein